MTDSLESIKKLAERASKAAQESMSDKPPSPVELGGVADKLPKMGGSVVISPPPVPAPPGGGPAPFLAPGGTAPKGK